ncbi:MAG: hypothetical protein AB1721_01720 [Patescibacteria group bacterium]
MITVSFSVKNKLYSFETEKSGQIILGLDKFLKSHKIKSSALDFFHIQASEKSGLLDWYLVQAIIKAKQTANFFDQIKTK